MKKKKTHLWNVFCVYAVYGVADILFGRDNEGEGKHAGGGHAVVQPEHPAVYVDMGDMKEPSKLPEYLQHCC